LSNHLGNVLVTISDKKIGVDANNDGTIDYYNADVVTASDYYPGGMDMPGRQYNAATGYRYSINGQEKTPEIAPNTTTAEFWQYDARIVRRWNIDPVLKDWESPYMAFSGNPIWFADIDGSDTTKPAPFSYMNTVSSNGNWLKGAMLLPGNTYVKAQNTVAGTLNGAVDLAKTSSKDGLGPGLMGMIDGWGEDLKDWWNGTKEYHTKTPASQQLKDAKEWVSNPDNVYGAISDAAIMYSTYRLQTGIAKDWSMKGNVPEWGSGGLVKKLVYPDITNSEVINTIGNRFAGLRDRKTKFEVKVFGSAVRGAPNPNDLDILIITTDKAIFHESSRAAKIINTIKNDFFEKSGKPLDVNIMSPDEYMRAKGGAFKADVEKVAKNF